MKCANCEEYLYESEAERVGDVYLHADCAQLAGFERCECCGDWFKREEMIDRDGELWCEDCVREAEAVRKTECDLRYWGRL